MKLMHLSDLHIGKRIYEYSMLEDQRHILREILAIAKEEKPSAVILAGDIYDRAVPSAEAVSVFDEFLSELAKCCEAVCVIYGNHDCAERLAFGSSLMEMSKVYVSPVYDGTLKSVCLNDEWGCVRIHLLPFLKPAVVRHVWEDEPADTTEEAVRTALTHLTFDPDERNVLVAHQFVTGANRCESEELAVGGVDQVPASVFEGFDYVALGHLHGPQSVERETIRYCGTPLKYSFSEMHQNKSVTIVELEKKGEVSVRTRSLHPLRDLREIRGTYLELTAKSFYKGTNTKDYIRAVLTDEEDIPDGLQKLRVIYPNLMQLLYDNQRTREDQTVESAENVEKKSELELFEEFYEIQNNQPMSEQQRTFCQEQLEKILLEGGR